jgi:hypothetical protein
MKKRRPPSDRKRLARGFGVAPKRRGLAITLGSISAAIGAVGGTVMFAPAVVIALGVAGFMYRERRAVQRGLGELDDWGFPVHGYRSWLLATEPTFDVELRREIAVEVMEESIAAIDPEIIVRKISARVFRIVTPRVALPGRKPLEPAVHFGDRELLQRIHDQLLAPLHADIGILGMVMGDRIAMQNVLPAPPPPDAPGDAFREPAMAAPPALQALVQLGPTAPVARDARRLGKRAERILHAAGKTPHGLATVAGLTLGGTMFVVQFFPPAWWLGAIGGFIGGVATALTVNGRNAAAVRNLLPPERFPIEGYDDWLLSGRPVFDLELQAPVDRAQLEADLRKIAAYSMEASQLVRWVEDISWTSPTRVRIETRPTLIHPSRRIEPFYGGSHPLFQQMLREVLEPLDMRVGIVAIHMGGNIERRI